MNKTAKGIIWGVVILGVGVGAYFGFQRLLKPKADPNNEQDEFAPVSPLVAVSNPEKSKRTIDSHRWLQVGSKDSSTQAEVEYLQKVLNAIISTAKDTVKYGHKMSKISDNGKSWIKSIASLKKLSEDGVWGSKETTPAIKIILGDSSVRNGTKLCLARKKRQDVASLVKATVPYTGSYWKGKVC